MEGKSCCAAKAEGPKTAVAGVFMEKLATYRPLLVMLLISILGALALPGVPFMHGVMGFFLAFLSALKLFNLKGFADGFARYDIVAGRVRAYAFAYPFIELGLALLYFSGAAPAVTGLATVAVMLAGVPGILGVIRRGEKVQCACVGSGLFSLPVGCVTLAENIVMGLMGLWLAAGF
jgi:hypothetical protein